MQEAVILSCRLQGRILALLKHPSLHIQASAQVTSICQRRRRRPQKIETAYISYIYMYMCSYIYIYTYICIHVHAHIYTHCHLEDWQRYGGVLSGGLFWTGLNKPEKDTTKRSPPWKHSFRLKMIRLQMIPHPRISVPAWMCFSCCFGKTSELLP